MYLLDTNIVSYWMRGIDSVLERIKACAPSDLGFSTITLAEILYGIEKSPVRKKERRIKIEEISQLLKIYPFNENAAQKYAVIRSKLEKEGVVISERDIQIASIAMANKMILVTHNVREFNRIAKLTVEDWA